MNHIFIEMIVFKEKQKKGVKIMSYQRLSGILMLVILGSWGVIIWLYYHPQTHLETVNDTESVALTTKNNEIKNTKNNINQSSNNENTTSINDGKIKIVSEFVNTYFNTNDQPFIKERVSLLNKNKIITEDYGKQMEQSIGDLDNEDAKMIVDELTIYSNDQENYLAIFELTYKGLDSNEVLVYVAKVHVNQTNQVDHYDLVATNTKLKTGE